MFGRLCLVWQAPSVINITMLPQLAKTKCCSDRTTLERSSWSVGLCEVFRAIGKDRLKWKRDTSYVSLGCTVGDFAAKRNERGASYVSSGCTVSDSAAKRMRHQLCARWILDGRNSVTFVAHFNVFHRMSGSRGGLSVYRVGHILPGRALHLKS